MLVGGSTRPLLLGPDAAHQNSTAPHKPSPRDAYVHDFFDEAGRLGVPVHGATLHKYVYLLERLVPNLQLNGSLAKQTFNC